MSVPLWRRFVLALSGVGIAGCLLHAQLASALVTRGDDAVRNGQHSAAQRLYRRALAFDAGSAVAADRLAFDLDMSRDRRDAELAVRIAGDALRAQPGDAALLADRALAEQHLRRWAAAEHDYAAAANAANDARYDHLAGRIATIRGHAAEARAYFRAALARDPHFAPARAALAER